MNILIANWTWYASGGDWTYVENITNIYSKKGHTVIPFSMQDDRNFPSPYSDYFIKHIDYKKLSKKNILTGIRVIKTSISSTEAKENLERLLDHVHIDLAHINVIHHYITPIILKTLKERGIKIIWTLHEYTPICPESTFISQGRICEKCFGGKFYHCITNKCKKESIAASTVAATENYINTYLNYYQYVDYYICPSVFLYEKFKSFNFFPEKLVQLYHGYNYEEIEAVKTAMKNARGSFITDKKQFFTDETTTSVPLTNRDVNDRGSFITDKKQFFTDEKYIVFAGRLEKIKGVHTLLSAMKSNPRIHLRIIGTGTQEDDLRSYAAAHQLSNVTFMGKQNRLQTLGIMHKAQFLVCPSEWYEVLGFTVVEAMALGKPVIGSAIGAIPEMVINHQTGLLFGAGNVSELAEKIQMLFDDQEAIQTMGKAAALHIRQLINSEKHFSGLQALISTL